MTAYKYQKQHASNYNYKPKRSFGQRLRNFFTFPEEDLKEEPSKEFEKIKLFTLTRGSLFLGIFVFMILINILVGFNINFLYLRQIFGFLFLILIPGLLIMLCFKIRTVKFWEYLVYTVGLSIAFIMFAGLAVNWTLPALGITDKPLSLWPILICFDIFLLGLWLTAISRNKDLKPFDITIPKLDTLNRIFFIIPMIFPLLSILGAFLLNNHGPNILTMIMLGGIAVYVLLIVIFRKHMNENIWPWAIYLIGLSLLLMYSMRSWIFMGRDIISEYYFLDSVAREGLWRATYSLSTYNSCLSINILPVVINIYVDLNKIMLLKFVMNVISSFILFTIYIFFKSKLNSFYSFLAVFFFISQFSFMVDAPSAIRQSIAFLFFSMMILVLFTKNIPEILKKVLFSIFGVSMIVSHYSTAYIALALFALTYIFTLIYKSKERREIKKGRLEESQKSEFYLTGTIIILLLVFGFLWYSQITPTSEGLINFVGESFSNFGEMFSKDLQLEGHSFLDQFSINNPQRDYNNLINNRVEDLESTINGTKEIYPEINTIDKNIKFVPQRILKTNTSYKFASVFYLIISLIKKLGYIFIFIGIMLSFVIYKKKEPHLILISFMGLILFIFVVLMTLIPLGSIFYGVLRMYQQALIILSPFLIYGISFISKKINAKFKIFLAVLFLIIYFLAFSGFFNQIVGGNIAFSNINNFGEDYDTGFVTNSEIDSIKWLSNFDINKKFYASHIYKSTINSFGNLPYPDWNIFPSVIKMDSYIYLGNSEVFNNRGFTYLLYGPVGFKFPIDFINNKKNLIYSNGGSEIFK